MKKLLIIAMAAMASVAAFGYTSASYVQDGLIAQWDGIDNVGTGVHDPAATVWKDLAGSYDLSLLPGGWWSGDGMSLSVNGAAAICSNSLPAYLTIEVVYKMKSPKGWILFKSGGQDHNKYRWVLFNYGSDISGLDGYFSESGSDDTKRVRWDSFDPSELRSMAATYEGNEPAAVYGNGAARNDGGGHEPWSLGDNSIMIGDRKEQYSVASWLPSYPWYGEVYAIRVYSRALSAEEIASNHAIDMARFSPSASDEYISDGLVARWDGIDNAGTGTHDPTATVWKDLAGNIDLTLAGESVGWTGGNALNLADFGDHAFNNNTNLMPKYKTIEIVCKETDWYGRVLFHSGDITRAVYFDRQSIGNGWECVVYFSGIGRNVYTKRLIHPFVDSEVLFLAARYGDDDTVADLFRDVENRDDGLHNNDWWDGTKITVGCVYTPAHTPGYNETDEPVRMYDWKGEVYAIRLYDRRLTKWELAHNNRIDRRRFLNSGSYIQRGLKVQWDGIDNAGRGVHDSSAATWKNLAVSGSNDLTVASGKWTDDSLNCVGLLDTSAYVNYAAYEDNSKIDLNTLEVAFKHRNPGNPAILFGNGYGASGDLWYKRYCALDVPYAMWMYMSGSYDVNMWDSDFTELSWSTALGAFANGAALNYLSGGIADDWGLSGDDNRVVVGGRTGNSAFLGDIYAIRIYDDSLTAHEVAYNAKVDDARFFQPNGGRTLTWQGPEASLADGAFGSNGCWKVAGKKWGVRDIPTVGDTAILPAGDYTVTIDEATWSLGALSIGAGAKLRLALPTDAFDASKAIVTVSGGIAADATAGLVIVDANAFGKMYLKSVTLIKCATASAESLQNLANNLVFVDTLDRRKGTATVVGGTKLVYAAPPPPGTIISIK